jgi:sulfatase maturation enzyme AslB (radical SAM superfamily)
MDLTVVYSNYCNLDCSYCCITNKNTSPFLSYEDSVNFVDYYLTKYKDEQNLIEFFGGEPTIHWQNIKDLMEYVDSKYENVHFRIYTNGHYNLKVQEDSQTWQRFDEIIFSVDGTYTTNLERTTNPKIYSNIIDNLKLLISLDCSVGVALVLFSELNFASLNNNFNYFKNLGVRYFHFEIGSIWEDNVKKFVKPTDFKVVSDLIVNNILPNNLKTIDNNTVAEDFCYFSVPREFLSSAEYFKNPSNKSCLDGVRSISPRGNIYYCRDLAANEESNLINNKEYLKNKNLIYKTNNDLKLINIQELQLNKNSDEYQESTRRFDIITPCPVKSFQFEQLHIVEDDVWWLQQKSKDLITPLFLLMDLTFYYINNTVFDDSILNSSYSLLVNRYIELYSQFSSNTLNV